MKNLKRSLTALLLLAVVLTSIPFVVGAANSYWGYDSYDTIEQPGAPEEITSYPTTITKVNNNVYTMTSTLDGGRTISISLIKEAWGTYNLGNWILTDGGSSYKFVDDSTDMEYVHLSQTLNGGICYTGGNHGNEAFVSIDFYNAETGAKLDFSAQSSYTTNGVHVIESTKLLRFNDEYNSITGAKGADSIGDYDGKNITSYTENEVYANVIRKYTFMGPQIKLNVDYTFTRDTVQWRSYNCMFPISKKYSLYCDMIDKNGNIIKTITTRPYGDTSIPNYSGPNNEGNDATRAVIYSADYPNYQFDIRVNTYKDSLNEHKNATYKTSYWDMNSSANKLYFTKYGDGGSMAVTQTAGTEYHTECIWLFNYVNEGREPSEGDIPVSRGKTYTNDVNTGSSEYNTSYGAKLTDGKAATTFDATNDSWYLFSMYSTNVVNAVGTTVIDLGNEYELSKVKLHLANVSNMGVGAPSSIKVYVSNDGVNFSADAVATVPTQSGENDIYWASAEIASGVTARYVKFDFAVPTGLAYVNEIEVYGNEPVQGPEDNLARGRDYNISVTNNPVIDTQYGTDYSAKLTDGKAATLFNATDASWFIFSAYVPNVSNGKGTVTIDFDKICNITELRLSLCNNAGWGVNAPTKIEVYGSVDGKTYRKIADMPVGSTDGTGYWSEAQVDNVEAGSVRFEFTLNGGFALLNEVEVHGTETATDYVPPVDDGGDDNTGDGNGNTDNDNDNTGDGNEEPTYKKGDVNMNGKLDARDYLLLKRAFFKTFTLQCADEIADINSNGKLDARDYLLLKRAFFGTYEIK